MESLLLSRRALVSPYNMRFIRRTLSPPCPSFRPIPSVILLGKEGIDLRTHRTRPRQPDLRRVIMLNISYEPPPMNIGRCQTIRIALKLPGAPPPEPWEPQLASVSAHSSVPLRTALERPSSNPEPRSRRTIRRGQTWGMRTTEIVASCLDGCAEAKPERRALYSAKVDYRQISLWSTNPPQARGVWPVAKDPDEHGGGSV